MRYRVSYLMPPRELREAIYEFPNTPAANAYRAVSICMGKDAEKFSADISKALSMGLYERVVDLDATDMEEVFVNLNSVVMHWSDMLPEKANAVFYTKDKLRSMSVGDLVDDGAGNYWAVASFGFLPISLETA